MTTAAARPHNKEAKETHRHKEPLIIEWREYFWPTLFMLSLSLVGLQMPLGLLFAAILLIRSLKENRYDFIIQYTLLIGGYSLLSEADTHLNLNFITFTISLIAILLLRKPAILKKALLWLAFYAIGLLYFMLQSDESFAIQTVGFRTYMSFIYFFVPFLVFSGEEFDIKKFFRTVYIYVFIFCTFYAIDCLIINGMVLLPRDPSWNTMKVFSTFYDPWFHPFSFAFPRRWPSGLYLLLLTIYPTARIYKLSWMQWGFIFLALIISRTFTFTAGYILILLFTSISGKKVVFYIIGIIAIVTGLYYIDTTLPPTTYVSSEGVETSTSALRIQSTIDQFSNLNPEKADEETLAEFATGRGAQIIPKFELLFRLDRQWIGFGFLSREGATRQKYVIENELYKNPEDAIEVATGVESTPFQLILDIGFLGLILHVLVFVGLWFVIRKLPHAPYYVSTALVFVCIGLAGFGGLIRTNTLYLVALSYAAIILNEKRQLGFDLPPLKPKAQSAETHSMP